MDTVDDIIRFVNKFAENNPDYEKMTSAQLEDEVQEYEQRWAATMSNKQFSLKDKLAVQDIRPEPDDLYRVLMRDLFTDTEKNLLFEMKVSYLMPHFRDWALFLPPKLVSDAKSIHAGEPIDAVLSVLEQPEIERHSNDGRIMMQTFDSMLPGHQFNLRGHRLLTGDEEREEELQKN